MGPEARLQGEIRRALELHGMHVWSTSAFRQRGPSGVSPGIPDLYVLDPARRRAAFMEVKTKRGRLSAAQMRFLQSALDAGQTCLVVRSVDDALRWMEEGPTKEEDR